MSKNDWYDRFIEEPLKDIVKELRNNGVNTCSSCGHERWIQANTYNVDLDLRTIYDVLTDLGETNFRTIVFVDVVDGESHKFIEITLPDQNGEYYNELAHNAGYSKYNPKTIAGNEVKKVFGTVKIEKQEQNE